MTDATAPSSLDGPTRDALVELVILGMHRGNKRLAREWNILREAEHCPAMFGRPQFVGRPIELPQSDVHGSSGKCHAVFAFPERKLGLPTSAPLKQKARHCHRLK